MQNFVSLRGFIRSFRRSQGDFAACGRRVSFPAMGKKPMAQATFSWPCGPIHLEDRRGTAQDGHFVSIFALPPVPRYVGRSPGRLCVISGAQNLSGGLNSCRATGPWVCKNCNRCGSRTAPGFTQPTLSCISWRAGLGPAPTEKTKPFLYTS